MNVMSRNLVEKFNLEVAKATSIENARDIALAYLKEEIEMISSEVKEELGYIPNSSYAVDTVSTAISKRLCSLLDDAFRGAPLFPLYIATCCSIAASSSLIDKDNPLSIKEKEVVVDSFLNKLERDGVYEV